MKELNNIFVTNPNIRKNAYLNWRFDKENTNEEKFWELGNTYLEVASHLIATCLKDNINSKLDGWIFPILFDIYQGLELYLKSYNHILSPEKEIIKGGHDIRTISGEVYNKLKELKEDNSEVREIYEEFKIVRNFIKMMYENTDNDISFVRYPINNRLGDFFYIGGREKINKVGEIYLDNITIDIEKLNDWLGYIRPILEKHMYYWDSYNHPEKY